MFGLPAIDRLRLAAKALMSPFTPEAGDAAYGLLNSVTMTGRGTVPDRSTQALLDTFNTSPWVMACALRVAEAVGSVQWKLYVARDRQTRMVRSDVSYMKSASKKERRKILKELRARDEVTEVTDHIFLDAITKGAAEDGPTYFTGRTVRILDCLCHDLVGDSFLVKQRNRVGAPVSFWPVPPHWVMNTPTIQMPYYRMSRGAWQKQIPAEDVLWAQNPNPVNPYGRGTGIAKSLDDDLAIDEYASKHIASFFKNSARPDLLVMPADGAPQFSNADRDRFEQFWYEKLGGIYKGFRPFFSTTQVKVEQIEQNFRAMQLKDIRQHERDTIVQVWGIPPELFGIIISSNRSTINMAPFIFGTYVVEPRLERFRDTWQYKLLPEYDQNLILDYESPVPDDLEFRLKTMTAQPGAFYANEFRELADLPDKPELEDVLMTPAAPSFGQQPQGDGEHIAPGDNLTPQEQKDLDRLLLKAARG